MNFRSKARKVQICYELLLFWSLPEGAKTEKSMIFHENSMQFHKKIIKMGKCADSVYIYIYIYIRNGSPPGSPWMQKSVKMRQNVAKSGPKVQKGYELLLFWSLPGEPKEWKFMKFFQLLIQN